MTRGEVVMKADGEAEAIYGQVAKLFDGMCVAASAGDDVHARAAAEGLTAASLASIAAELRAARVASRPSALATITA